MRTTRRTGSSIATWLLNCLLIVAMLVGLVPSVGLTAALDGRAVTLNDIEPNVSVPADAGTDRGSAPTAGEDRTPTQEVRPADSGKHRGKHQAKDQGKRQGKDKDKNQSKHKDKHQGKDQNKHKDKKKQGKDQNKHKDKKQNKNQGKDQNKHQGKDQGSKPAAGEDPKSDATAAANAGNARDDSPGTGADPAAVDDAFTTDEDTPFTTGDVRGSAAEGQPLTVTAVDTTGTKGLVTDNGDGTFDYDPNGQFETLNDGETATDTFTYSADDGNGGTSTATVTITVTGVDDSSDTGGNDDADTGGNDDADTGGNGDADTGGNDDPGTGDNDDPGTGGNERPDALDDEAATDEQAATTIDVRANDSDPDQGDVLSVTVIDDRGTQGRATINGKGKVDYDPNGTFDALKDGETATDTFAYTVDDGHGGTDTATVKVTITGVDDAPDEGDDQTRDDPEDGAPKPPQDGADAAKWVALGDGFESGDLSQWTESDGLRVQTGAAAAGRYGARAKSTGDAAYATKTLSSEESDLYARVKFMLLDQGNNPVTLLALRTAAGDALVSVYIESDGRLTLGNAVTDSTATGPTTVTKGVWHEVELHAQTGTSGQIEVWYDGQRLDKLSRSQQLGTKPIGRVVLGESSRGRSYDVAFDDVAVDTSFVHPEIVADDTKRVTTSRTTARADEPVDSSDGMMTTAALEDDTTPPETTIDTAPPDPTDQTSATFTFAADEPGATFECTLDGGGYEPCASPTTYGNLVDGGHTFAVRATDGAGNTDPTPATHTWSVDATAPETTIDAGPAGTTASTEATFAFASNEAGASFECALDGAAYEACSSPAEYPALGDGEHTFGVRATDAAGNVDPTPATHTWTVDATAPETTIDTGPSGTTNETTASFAFTSNEAGATFTCALDGAAYESCASPASYDALGDGEHAFAVRATDAAGNTDPTPATHTWSIDATGPETTIESGPSGLTSSTSATFSFTASEALAIFACALDGAAFTLCLSPAEYTGLGAGEHTFRVRATDLLGNTDPTPAAQTWTIDIAAPETTIDAGPSGATTSTTAAFAFSSDDAGAGFACALDGGAFAACASPVTFSDLADGNHTFEVRAVDAAGNADPSPATRTWTVDATAPTVTGVAPADGAVDVAANANVAATFSEAMDEASLEAQGVFTLVAEGGATPVAAAVSYDATTGTATLDPEADLTEGTTYTAMVTTGATDAAGNPLATDETWTFTTVAPADTTAPETAIDAGPSGTTNETTASFAFSATEPGATFECALDGAAFAACASPTDYSGLGDGEHTFAVRAKDAAGNVDPTPATRAWTVDATAPTVVSIGPADGATGVAAGANAAATFSEAMDPASVEAAFTLAPQGGGPVAATITYDPATKKATLNPTADLAPGTAYTAMVTGGASGAKDATGNPLAADKTWTFTTAGPDTLTVAVEADAWVESASPSLNHGTEQGLNTDNSPQQEGYLKFTVSGVTGTITGATLRLTAYNGTPNGPKIYAVADSSWSETGITWSTKPARSGAALDDEGAVTATTSAPAVVEYNVGAVVTGNGTYTVSLVADSGDAIQFRSREYGTPSQRPQLVLQINGSGSALETTIDPPVPASPTNLTTATFTFSSNDPGATFECTLDGAAFAACASPKQYTGLADGTHTFQVRASDLAGNGTDQTPATFTWSVDATAPTVSTVAPPDEAADVATSTDVEATFSEAMDAATVTAPGIFTLTPQGGGPVAATVTYDPTTRKATLNPNADLTPNTIYTAKVLGGASGAKDAVGNPLAADRVWSFTVPADTTAPTVVSVLPAEGATGVAVASNVEAVFSEAMDPTTLTTSTVTLAPQAGGGTITATVVYDAVAKKVILDPVANLAPETTYTATVKGGESGAKDLGGLPLATDKVWSFTTADVTAPTVTSVAPADAATGVAVGANAAAIFSEAMDAATLTTATFTLVRQGTTTPVAAPVNYDAAAKRATLNPDANLAAGTTYTATVKGGPSGAKDLGGLPLATDKTWSFTTAGTTMTAAVEADAWVESANPSTPHGTDPFLSIDNSPLSEGFLRFTVSGAGDVSQAKLRLYAYNGTDNAPKVYRVTDSSWSETGITWSTKPARSGTPVDTTSLVPTNSWVEYDVSSMVTANGTYTFNLVPDTGDLLQVRSREYAADPTLRPQLVLTVGAPGGPGTTITPPTPANSTNQTTASFTFSSDQPGTTFECKLDTGTFSTCTSPQEYTGLAAGPHTFEVRAIDAAGNPDETPAAHTWTVDTTPPTVATVVPADGAPNAPSTANVEATFSEAMDPATLTGATFMLVAQGSGSPVAAQVSPAAGATKAILNPDADLTPGVTYNATVTTGAKDAAGNTLAASYLWSFTVADTTPPVTSLDPPLPANPTNQTSATFAFSANEQGATFECRLDGGAWASCTSSRTVTSLTGGVHTFEVRAIDASGNVDPTPASHTWTVDTTPPTVTILTPANAATGVAVTANVEATFSEPMNAATVTAPAVFTLKPQGGSDVAAAVAYDPTTRKATLNPNANLTPNTTYTAQVLGSPTGATDLAGNALAANRIWSFTTSGTAPTLTFGAQADAWVESANPGTNYGSQNTLKVDSSPQVESFLRFAVSGTSGTVTSARLRLYATSATVNGPAVYAVPNNSWSETGVTWSTKPARTGSPSDDKGAISAGGFVEFDVTPLVAGDGTYSFNLVGTSDDVVDFASRSNTPASQRPQLLVTFNGTLPLTVSASPAGGTYTSGQLVTLTASEEPSTKYYTTDGSDPTTSSTRIVYGGPITIATSKTLKFYAVAPDARTSPVVSEVYTIASTTGFQGATFTGTSAPTSKENESKLWYNDGSWWGVLYNTSTTDFQIYRLDSTTQEWSDTGVKVDLRNMAKVDVLWDGTKLFTLAHHWNSAASGRAELRRFSYNAANDQYTQELGPIPVNNFGSETAVLAKDTTGTLWVTYTQDSKVYVTRSAGANHDTWVTPYVLPTAGSSVYSDDISTIVSFGGKIGVLWSNQCDQTQGRCSTIQNKMLFAWHSDGAADNAWTEEVAYDIPNLSGGTADEAADDHMNIKVDSSGRLYAAFKTSLNASGEPLIGLLVRETNGTWSSRTVFTADFNHTRPIVLIDEQNGVLYVFASEGPGTNGGKIYYKQASLSNPSFPAGIGTVIIENGTDVTINNVNSTKQNVDSTTGIVIIAGEVQNTRYYHNVINRG